MLGAVVSVQSDAKTITNCLVVVVDATFRATLKVRNGALLFPLVVLRF